MNDINEKNDDKLIKLYTLAEMTYENYFKNMVLDRDQLYPNDWNIIKNYKEKIEIMAEAIKTNNLIVNTSKYQNLINFLKDKNKLKNSRINKY